MPSTFSPSLRIELIGTGEKSGTWGVATNNNLGDLLEQAIVGSTTVNITAGNVTLTALNGVTDQSRSVVLFVTGTPGVARNIVIPNVKKNYTVKNTSDSTANIKTAAGVAFAVPSLSEAYIYCDGNDAITGRVITDGANTILSNPTPYNSPAFTGIPTAPTAPIATNNTQIATTAFVRSILPAGVIMMWSGSIASIPAGWLLCDGTGGTPDLRDRFIVGAGSTYAVGDTGGANSVTLTEAQMPSHIHTGTTNNSDAPHTHAFTSGIQSADHTHSGTTAAVNIDHTHTGTTGTESVGHTHTGSGTTSSTSIDHSHNGSGTTSLESADHSHSGTTGSENQNHTHGVAGNTGGQSANHQHTGTTGADGNHLHQLYSDDLTGAGGGGNPDGYFVSSGGVRTGETTAAGSHTHSFTTGFVSSDHSHYFSVTSAGISNNHQHAFSTGGVSANHSHTYSFTTGGMTSNVSHTHTYSFTTGNVSANHTHSITTGGMNSNASHSHSITTGVQSADHTHSGTTNSASIDHNHTFGTAATGGGLAHENRPPYYALAYIQKT